MLVIVLLSINRSSAFPHKHCKVFQASEDVSRVFSSVSSDCESLRFEYKAVCKPVDRTSTEDGPGALGAIRVADLKVKMIGEWRSVAFRKVRFDGKLERSTGRTQ
jgi:hypothetical protein